MMEELNIQPNCKASGNTLLMGATPTFLLQFGLGLGASGIGAGEMDTVTLDHCYAKPWSAHPDASNARPARMLFMSRQMYSSSVEMPRSEDGIIDVVNTAPIPSVAFDVNKAHSLMVECEHHALYARTDNQEDWEEKVSKTGWTIQQARIYGRVIKALQADRLARLAIESVSSVSNEPVVRRQIVDTTARRLRNALAYVGWDTKVVQWLHHLILDNISVHLLACYLDALQVLKSKVPVLVDKMMSGATPKCPSLSEESLGQILKRPWDPVGYAILQQKPKRLPNSPLLMLAPSGSAYNSCKRLKFWQSQLSNMGKVIITNVSGGGGNTVGLHLEQMIGALRTKVLEQKSHNPDKPIILFGWDIEAVVCCHVSLVEDVNAVICLGFPYTGTLGPRGDCEDPLLSSTTPMLFVIGQNASNCSINMLQELREHMRSETGLVVVGGADKLLRLSHRHKREQGVTQTIVDHLIIHEIGQFLGSILTMKSGMHDQPPSESSFVDSRKKRKRKLSPDMVTVGTFGGV